MEVALVAVGAVVLLAWAGRHPGYRHWRGPTSGTLDEVQREHLDLYFPPDPTADVEDEE